MDPLGELLASDHRQTLELFHGLSGRRVRISCRQAGTPLQLMLETAAAQCLLLSEFFEDLDALGATFFSRTAARETSVAKARLFEALAERFEPWRQRHARLSRELRDWPYLLRN